MRAGDLSPLRGLPRHTPPAVLLGGLNVLRALGIAGVPVIVASPDGDEPALSSRYCTARWALPRLADPEAVVASLESLAARLDTMFASPAPLLFSNDDFLRLVHAHRDRLQRRFRMLLNDPATTLALLDKDRFVDFAAARALPVPRVLSWERLHEFPGPVLIKPAGEGRRALAELFEGAKAIVRANGAAARSDPALERVRDHVVFCEYVAGTDRDLWCFDGVADARGRVLAWHLGRKLRCAPPLTGDSSYIELARNASLAAVGLEVAAAVPLRGIFNMDFKRDPASGRWYLLEINARCNLWNYIGARNGLNLTKIHYDDLLGRAQPAIATYRTRYRWIDFKLDRAAYRASSVRGVRGFSAWLLSLLRLKIYSVFAWSDPKPWIRMWADRVRSRAGRAARRFGRVAQPAKSR